MERNTQEFVIDIKTLARVLWRRAWIILLVGALVATAVFVYTSYFVTPKYSARVMLYVNNRNTVDGDGNISASDLSAAQSLVDTYIGILKTRTTMEKVAEKSALAYAPAQLMSMTSASEVEGTELFTVTVTCTSAAEAAVIANSIADVLPARVESTIEGSSMRVVDYAEVNNTKVSPNITSSTVIGALLGCFAAAALFVVLAVLDDTVRDDDYLTNTYGVPVLSRIPSLSFDEEDGRRYGNYGYSYGYGRAKRKAKGEAEK